jgi:hypothetical protein
MLQFFGADNSLVYTTQYLLWESAARKELFSKISYVLSKDQSIRGSIPKLGSQLAATVLHKLRKSNETMSINLRKSSNNQVFYRRGGLYWKVFTDQPTFSNEEKVLRLLKEVDRYAIIAALSSNLWFWYYITTSDCRHLGNRDISTFPVGWAKIECKTRQDLASLGNSYVNDIKSKAVNRTRTYKGVKQVNCLSFSIKDSKEIIDSIDTLLGKIFGFSDEELDFIINYDIKYRMGSEDLN